MWMDGEGRREESGRRVSEGRAERRTREEDDRLWIGRRGRKEVRDAS